MTFEDVLAGAGVTILPVNQRCGPGQTHAAGVLRSIYRQHGGEHLARVFACIAASGERELWSETIASVSDCLSFRSERPQDALEAAFRAIDLTGHRRLAVRLRPWPVRHSLRSLIDRDLTIMEKQAA
jgi:hypothetical protein